MIEMQMPGNISLNIYSKRRFSIVENQLAAHGPNNGTIALARRIHVRRVDFPWLTHLNTCHSLNTCVLPRAHFGNFFELKPKCVEIYLKYQGRFKNWIPPWYASYLPTTVAISVTAIENHDWRHQSRNATILSELFQSQLISNSNKVKPFGTGILTALICLNL